ADQILLFGTSPGGQAMASDKEFRNAKFADEIAGVGGVGELDVEALQKLLAGKHATASASIGSTTELVEAGASVRDLETMFQLVHLERPARGKDDQAIAVWRTTLADQLANRLRVPEVQFQIQSEDLLYKHNPRYKSPEPADIPKVDADKALAFYKDRFG